MSKQDPGTTIQELKDAVIQFREERSWGKHHTPKNLAMSIAIEAAELMEHFQWDEYSDTDTQEVAAELADVINYCLGFADALDIDIATACRDKLAHNSKKYPVEIFNETRDSKEDYVRIKREYRSGKSK